MLCLNLGSCEPWELRVRRAKGSSFHLQANSIQDRLCRVSASSLCIAFNSLLEDLTGERLGRPLADAQQASLAPVLLLPIHSRVGVPGVYPPWEGDSNQSPPAKPSSPCLGSGSTTLAKNICVGGGKVNFPPLSSFLETMAFIKYSKTEVGTEEARPC